jgi:hypothetical protein
MLLNRLAPRARLLVGMLLAFLFVAVEVVAHHYFGAAASWGAVGTGAVYLKNLPPPNTYTINAQLFAKNTSRNKQPYPALAPAGAGWGQSVNQVIDATGVVGRILLLVKFTITNPAGGTPTVTNQWPWNLLKNVTVSANGINNLFSCDGLDLRALCRVRNPFFFDRESAFAITAGANSVWSGQLLYEIPLAFDDQSLMGAVFAQTQDTNLSFTAQIANTADLWVANTPALTACTITPVVEFYSIPYVDTQQGRVAVIPDLRRMHGFYAQTSLLQATTFSPLMRINGILARVLQRGDNAANANGDVNFSTLVTDHKFNYGSNVVPTDVPGIVQRMENEKDYGDQMLPATDVTTGSVSYLVDDLVRDNALRDVVHLLGVTQPQFINVFNGLAITNGNSSVMRTVQEHMIAQAT